MKYFPHNQVIDDWDQVIVEVTDAFKNGAIKIRIIEIETKRDWRIKGESEMEIIEIK